jgi:hypothetical protein
VSQSLALRRRSAGGPGRLPEETHALIECVRDRFGVEVEIFAPEAAQVEAMVAKRSPNVPSGAAAVEVAG